MIWEEIYGNTLLRVTLVRAILTSFVGAIPTTRTAPIQQDTVAPALTLPSAAVVSAPLCIVVLKAKPTVSKL